jgi:(2Fe-2S) ferredoxin
LTLYVYLENFTAYETYHHDGFLSSIIDFAFPTVEKFTCQVQPSRVWGTDRSLEDAAKIVQEKLSNVFTGKWPDSKSVPLLNPPPRKVSEDELPPLVKRGIIALGD